MKKLYVRALDTREIVHTVEVHNTTQVERVMLGMLRNMDTDRFFIDDSEFDEEKKP